jgi:hypothetical protein
MNSARIRERRNMRAEVDSAKANLGHIEKEIQTCDPNIKHMYQIKWELWDMWREELEEKLATLEVQEHGVT